MACLSKPPHRPWYMDTGMLARLLYIYPSLRLAEDIFISPSHTRLREVTESQGHPPPLKNPFSSLTMESTEPVNSSQVRSSPLYLARNFPPPYK